MNILGIGPLEILFILIVAFALIGPKDLAKTGRTIGTILRKIVISSEWQAMRSIAHEIQITPHRLMREAGYEEIQQMGQEVKNSLDVKGNIAGLAKEHPDFEALEGFAAWTQLPVKRSIMPNPLPTVPKNNDRDASQGNTQSNAE
ncbi:MAG: hypothetical protein MUC85_07745 [Anaerolineales bacterium]|jgi:Sec-independent protein translocase protein TatA|nr:hypothetical protein [Anaerolineales bacterium]